MDHLVDLEFNELVTSLLEVIEHEKLVDAEFLSPEGGKIFHAAIDVAKGNLKDMV